MADEPAEPPSTQGQVPFSFIHGVPVYFNEDWRTGIGGGLWSTGLALSRYLNTNAAAENLQRVSNQRGPGLSILELGSGNGFLSVCLAALACSHHIHVKDLVVTDMDEDHLSMIRATVAANEHTLQTIDQVTITEHCWGDFHSLHSDGKAGDDSKTTPTKRSNTDIAMDTKHFDLIVGSDVAYRDFLYDPLIRSIQHFSHSKTVSLIGVTMTDTTPDFFHRLDAAGLRYQKLAEHLLDAEFRGPTFGIFVILPRR